METAGIVVGAVGLVALENTVEECFQKVSTWRHMGQDYEHYSLQLDMANIAFQRWTQSVRLADDATAANAADLSIASTRETETVLRLLGAIKSAFQDAEKTSQRYETAAPAPAAPDSLEARVQAAVRARQGGVKVLDKARWMVHDKKAIRDLVERVSTNVEQLTKLFPATTERVQEQLATLDLMDIVPPETAHEREDLARLQNFSVGVDPAMRAVAREAERHCYSRMIQEGNANVLNGDEIARGVADTWRGTRYELGEARGHARVQNGDRYGMPSDFWGKGGSP